MNNKRIPPKCTIDFHATLPIKSARQLADSGLDENGSFFVYFQVRGFNGKRLREVDVYRYTPIAKS